MMMSDRPMTVRKSFSQEAFLVFQRCAACYLFVIGLGCWAALIGLSMNGAWRFDLVTPNIRAVEAVLAVIFPIAATGLWFGVGWGFVLWVVGAVIQVSAHGGYTQTFGAAPWTTTMHVAGIASYIAFWFYLVFIRRH